MFFYIQNIDSGSGDYNIPVVAVIYTYAFKGIYRCFAICSAN